MSKPQPRLSVRPPAAKNADAWVTGAADQSSYPSESTPEKVLAEVPTIDVEAADDNVRSLNVEARTAEVDVQLSEPAPTAPRKQKRIPGTVKRAKGKEKVLISVYLDPETALHLRRYCFENGERMADICSHVLIRAIRKLPLP